VPKLRSVNNIVIPPASTGRDSNNKTAVTKETQTNIGILIICIPGALMFKIVTMKFIAPAIDAAPAKCKLNIAKSTLKPEWLSAADNGG